MNDGLLHEWLRSLDGDQCTEHVRVAGQEATETAHAD